LHRRRYPLAVGGRRGDDRIVAVQTTTDTGAILGRIEPVLLADPVRNTIFATVRAYLRQSGEGGWCAYNSTAIAARSGVADPVALTDGWSDLAALADALAQLPTVAGLGGPVPSVESLVELLGREPRHRIAERLYRLDRLAPPMGVLGRARPATEADIELVTTWVEPYTIETFGVPPPEFDPRRLASMAINYSRTWLWLDPTGTPVSMAARRPLAAGVSRIGPVYTPPEHRGHGYGSAVTARAAFDILDQAAVPVLYTDVSNPTSNKIYRAIGFRPVADRMSVMY
jgi:GNAT superfamily N-acetyltransferase